MARSRKRSWSQSQDEAPLIRNSKMQRMDENARGVIRPLGMGRLPVDSSFMGKMVGIHLMWTVDDPEMWHKSMAVPFPMTDKLATAMEKKGEETVTGAYFYGVMKKYTRLFAPLKNMKFLLMFRREVKFRRACIQLTDAEFQTMYAVWFRRHAALKESAELEEEAECMLCCCDVREEHCLHCVAPFMEAIDSYIFEMV